MITILCSGSRGDIQPYIALGLELQKCGKEVRICTGKSFEGFVTSYGLSFAPLSADIETARALDPELLRAAQSSDNPLKMLLSFRKMKAFANRMAADTTAETFRVCADSELIVYHPGCAAGYFAARQLNIPAVLATPFPLHRTKAFASMVAYGRYPLLPKGVSYTLMQGMLWSVSKDAIATYWKEHWGPLPKDFGCPFEKVDPRHPAIVSCSNAVFSRPKDWDANIHQSGYWFMPESESWQPPPALADFLAAGPKPVYIGFGSVLDPQESEQLAGEAVRALEMAGMRGILCGFSQLPDLPENIFAIRSVPHRWLFPQMAAVCHHGGAGTTAAGFTAGVPGIIVPFSNDQFAWAHRAWELGVAPKPFPKKHLTAKRLAEALTAIQPETVQRRAAELGRTLGTENGTRDAAEVILAALTAKP